jgi:hypothetical protein
VVFPVRGARIEAWVPKAVLTAARAEVVEVRGDTVAEERGAASQDGVAVTARAEVVARDGTAVEMASLPIAVEQDEAGAGPALSGVEAEPVWFLVGWGAPEVEPDDYPVELGGFEAGVGSDEFLVEPVWFVVEWDEFLAEPAWFAAEWDGFLVGLVGFEAGRDERAAQPDDSRVELLDD